MKLHVQVYMFVIYNPETIIPKKRLEEGEHP